MDFRKSFSKPFKKFKDKLRDGRSGSEDSRKGREADVKGGDVSQRDSYLRSDVCAEDVAESGPSAEGSNIGGKEVALVDVDPPTSMLSISRIGEPNGMRTILFSIPPLIGPSRQHRKPCYSRSSSRCS